MKRLKIEDIVAKKKKGEKITMLTAYDYPLAVMLDGAGVDMILVGDSLANVILGLENTRDVGMEEMLHHAKAVNRGVQHALLIGDMPFSSYQLNVADAVKNAERFVGEAGCNAIKLEWFDRCLEVAESIVGAGVPVMGHVGLTPQTADKIGGFVVQGRDHETAQKLINQAKDLEVAGCFSLVLECIPDRISEIITREVSIPTIGIGAGVYCDGQVLVTHDLLGLYDRFRPKFAKQYVDLSQPIKEAVSLFLQEVKSAQFPDQEHSFTIKKSELDELE